MTQSFEPGSYKFDQEVVEQLFRIADTHSTLSAKIEAVSASLLGKPYIVNPLIGGQDSPEQLSVPLDSYDCVTLVETVLAVCLSKRSEDFLNKLVALRYENETIDWFDRNHYSVEWIKCNERKGFVTNVTPKEHAVCLERNLSILPGYPAKHESIFFLPVEQLCTDTSFVETGDLIYFGTSRENLDVSHVGFLIRTDGGVIVRHSAKSQGGVVDESLTEFFDRFGATPGVIIVRPQSLGM